MLPQLTESAARIPLRESLWARLLMVLDRCDRPIEALKYYEMIRVRIVQELGVGPGPEPQQVYRELLRAATRNRSPVSWGRGVRGAGCSLSLSG
ncbi:BTAD domain-containing putative transcriptional regulator [Streptomyces sp. NPDC018057]|uniref:AfsR/SARP family transcriptional regulator n=1 Tax=unclassified Streptomyces TaxID=2593676 RepID=UPI00378F7434